jgi:hypothetical protein
MSTEHPGFRLFFLGAGFSRPAGLPLALELFPLIQKDIEAHHGSETKFHRDLHDYLDYREACHRVGKTEPVDFEQFMSYLDIEHYLRLRGSKTWSSEGNESQIMMRKAIGRIVHDRTPPADELPDVYYEFASRLSAHDTVLTTNYDTVLERAFEHIGKPYRLFPHRYKEVHASGSAIVDSDAKETPIFKLHGSVDWFDDQHYLALKGALVSQGVTTNLHSVFDDPTRYGAAPLVSGLRPPDDSLLHIHRIAKVDDYYARDKGFNAPFILSPSTVKFVYAKPILDLWDGMGRAGGWNLGVSIIGFSLPDHDEYVRVGLYQMTSNYQQSWWNEKMLDVLKDNVKLVDYRTDDDSVAEYRKRYCFVDDSRAEYLFEGFSTEAISFLFDKHRSI